MDRRRNRKVILLLNRRRFLIAIAIIGELVNEIVDFGCFGLISGRGRRGVVGERRVGRRRECVY